MLSRTRPRYSLGFTLQVISVARVVIPFFCLLFPNSVLHLSNSDSCTWEKWRSVEGGKLKRVWWYRYRYRWRGLCERAVELQFRN